MESRIYSANSKPVKRNLLAAPLNTWLSLVAGETYLTDQHLFALLQQPVQHLYPLIQVQHHSLYQIEMVQIIEESLDREVLGCELFQEVSYRGNHLQQTIIGSLRYEEGPIVGNMKTVNALKTTFVPLADKRSAPNLTRPLPSISPSCNQLAQKKVLISSAKIINFPQPIFMHESNNHRNMVHKLSTT